VRVAEQRLESFLGRRTGKDKVKGEAVVSAEGNVERLFLSPGGKKGSGDLVKG